MYGERPRKERHQMTKLETQNKLEAKAAELVAMAKEYGIEATVDSVGGHTVYVHYNRVLSSVIAESHKGNVLVRSYDQVGRRSDYVALRSLPSYLDFYATRAKLAAACKRNPAIDDQTVEALESVVA